MGGFILGVIVVVALLVFLAKFGKAKPEIRIGANSAVTTKLKPIIDLGFADIHAGKFQTPTWSGNQDQLNVFYASLAPLTVSPFDSTVAECWLEGEGTRKDLLTFLYYAELAGLNVADQFSAGHEIAKVLMKVLGGDHPDKGVRDAELLIAHVLRNTQWSETTRAPVEIASVASLGAHKFDKVKISHTEESFVELIRTFREKEMRVQAKGNFGFGSVSMTWRPFVSTPSELQETFREVREKAEKQAAAHTPTGGAAASR